MDNSPWDTTNPNEPQPTPQPALFEEPHTMKHTESEYINAGYRYEQGKTPAETLRHMIEAEELDDRAEARRLIEQGRREARQ